jgi:hypothetical protein
MKRYRVLAMDFDTRATLLAVEVKNDWEPAVREQWLQNQAAIRAELVEAYGPQGFARKLENLLAIGGAPFSLIAFHNAFFAQARTAFVMGCYYPALTSICALGERVLNHLVLTLRDEYRNTAEYKRVYRKDSFDNWDVAIDVLSTWGAILPAAADHFRTLKGIRHRTLHFNPATERDVRSDALAAVLLFQEIISTQFAAFGPQPWYIPNEIGFSLVRKAWEDVPFVKHVVLPNCALVGPAHDLRGGAAGDWEAIDDNVYSDEEISDEEFVPRFKAAQATKRR